jgi:hypothetical protein
MAAPLSCTRHSGPAEKGTNGVRRSTARISHPNRLAGISVDYVMRLEQGRARNPSAQVVTALADRLRLSLLLSYSRPAEIRRLVARTWL